jgi:hypothetical protein
MLRTGLDWLVSVLAGGNKGRLTKLSTRVIVVSSAL